MNSSTKTPPADDEATKTVKMSTDELRRQLHELGVDVEANDPAPADAPSTDQADHVD